MKQRGFKAFKCGEGLESNRSKFRSSEKVPILTYERDFFCSSWAGQFIHSSYEAQSFPPLRVQPLIEETDKYVK